MEMQKISAAAMVLLAGLILTGCDKNTPRQKTSSPGLSANSFGGNAETNMIARDLGELALTNRCETCVALGARKECLVTPKMIDSHNVQLTLAVETRTAKGKVHDLSITQVVTLSGKSFEVAVGAFNFSLTPNVTSE